MDWSFDVRIACSNSFESDVVLTDESPTAAVENLDVGTTCTVSEDDPQGATSTAYSPGPTSDAVQSNETTAVMIDNRFDAEVGGIVGTRPSVAEPVIGVEPVFTG
jgi:hypothetical protein